MKFSYSSDFHIRWAKNFQMGFKLKFNLALNTNNPEVNSQCNRVLFNSSQELCNIVLKSTEEKVKHLQRELYICRVNLFNQFNYFFAHLIWKSLEYENFILHNDLKAIEKKKMRKTIRLPASPDHGNTSNTTQRKHIRRYNKDRRIQRKREQFHAKHRSTPFAVDDNKLQHLNPVNLSEHVLSEDQTKLLRKGPSFCPAPQDINWQEVHDDLEAFEARLRTAVFFMEKDPEEPASDEQSQNHLPPIPGKKGWKPPISKLPELELFLSSIRKDILNPCNIRNFRDNLSKGERSALSELRNSDATIRIQDKGSRFVLINSTEYNDKMLGQLNNQLHYKVLKSDPTTKHLGLVEQWCSKWLQRGEISPEIASWIVNRKAKPGVAFGNIKTHKKDNPLRLITSCCGTAIENLSAFTEFYLQPLARKQPSFVKDTTDLLNRIQKLNEQGPFPVGTLLVSWDVVSMFPNIDNELGLGAVRSALDTSEQLLPSTNSILEAVEICLKSNHSVFNEKFYLQIHGTAMGPKNACSYADIAMGEIDHKAKHCGPIKPSQWWRYRDDIFDLWQQGLAALNSFTEYINSLYPTIKFELVYSESKLSVLDVSLHLVDGFIQTDVYSKPTDSHLYLSPSSAHPKHVFKAIPFGVASRLRRNCSEDNFLAKRLEEYKGYLIDQGYPAELVSREFSRAVSIPRNDLLKAKVKNSKKIFPFVLTYNPNLPSINGLIKKHFHLLLSCPKLRELFPPNSIISSFRRPKNLKEILAPSKCRKSSSQSTAIPTAGCFTCDKTRCDLCKNFLVNSQTFSSAQTGKTYFVRQKLSCNSSNVIYLVHCKKCNLQYVGSTTTEFKVRFRNHKSSMKTNKKTCEVAIHFNRTPHVLSDFTFQCIDQIQTDTSENTEKLLITKEAYWSAQLFSLSPFGLNKRQEFHSKNRIHYT
jgi:hypothetical protein